MSNSVASTTTSNIVPVQAQFDASGNCLGLIGPGGVFFSPPLTSDAIVGATIDNSVIGGTTAAAGSFTTLSAVGPININSKLFVSNVLPTVSSGFGTGPVVTANNSSAFKIVIGTGGAASGTVTFPAAPNGWIIQGWDVTNGTSLFLQQTAFTTTSATVTSYSITTGLAANMSAGDVCVFSALPF